MSFSEKLKKEVRHKASFRCCRCQSIDVEIHHILPQKDGGLDLIENAAPLCPNCHSGFGGNPEKRKIITEMRDSWYTRVEEKYSSKDNALLEKISNEVETIKTNQMGLEDLKDSLKIFVDGQIQRITSDTAVSSVSGIINSTNAATGIRLGEGVYSGFECRGCNKKIGLLIGTTTCPDCGEPIQ